MLFKNTIQYQDKLSLRWQKVLVTIIYLIGRLFYD